MHRIIELQTILVFMPFTNDLLTLFKLLNYETSENNGIGD